MVIVIDSDGTKVSLRCAQPQNLGRASVVVDGFDVVTVLRQIEGFTVLAEEPYSVLVDPEVLRTLGLAAVGQEWIRAFERMLVRATNSGWVSEGKIKLHVEVGGG